ncbi:protein ELF4-LIKE 3-like [Senna tora]|uniref:Protein ELF4-LIKE 3-like n=1 Tax=Senna tora TaxID=362788 RepID=A0A834T241_9FABA|nr:protein ELF4-LIKE 3-like [Senna tora]
MEGDTLISGVNKKKNSTENEGKIMQTFQKSFVQVQNILDQNRVLISEINQNHESKVADNLSRNVGLIKELNNNIRRVVDLYADLSSSFTKSMEVSSEADSSTGGHDVMQIKLASEL